MSDFAPEVTKYPKSNKFRSVWAYCFTPDSDAACLSQAEQHNSKKVMGEFSQSLELWTKQELITFWKVRPGLRLAHCGGCIHFTVCNIVLRVHLTGI